MHGSTTICILATISRLSGIGERRESGGGGAGGEKNMALER